MRIMKMAMAAVFAVLAFSAIGALGASSASALLFLTSTGTSESYTVKSLSKPLLETKGGQKVECESVAGSGTILNKTDRVDKVLFTFHKCKAFAELVPCKSSGEPAELIKTLDLSGLLVTLLNGKYGILIQGEGSKHLASFSCGVTENVVVEGSVVGEFTESKAESETFKTVAQVEFKKGAGAGEPAIKDYETLKGLGTPNLETTITGVIKETKAESSEQALGDVLTTNTVKFCHT